MSSVPVPLHSASAQDPLRHHGCSRCSALLQQAQVMECESSKTGCLNRHRLNRDHQLTPLAFSSSEWKADITQTFVWVSSHSPSGSNTSSFSSFSPSSRKIQEPSLLLSASPGLLPLALSVSLPLLQLLPSTQDLPEMCRFWLLGNTTVLLKLQMEALQSNVWLVGFSVGRAAAMLYDHMSLCTCFVHINMSFEWCHILSVSKGNEMLLFLNQGHEASILENTIHIWYADRMWFFLIWSVKQIMSKKCMSLHFIVKL